MWNGCCLLCVGAYVLIGLYIFNVSTLTVFCRSGGTLIMLSALKWSEFDGNCIGVSPLEAAYCGGFLGGFVHLLGRN